ncbi:hypothetical protein Tco_0842640 [Tanacetum coccineum]|uniref:MutS-like protein n=1 Tax=Tanacetum coccineum TaxID=301880 RepID=A0ABQ5B3Q2_9ASTR
MQNTNDPFQTSTEPESNHENDFCYELHLKQRIKIGDVDYSGSQFAIGVSVGILAGKGSISFFCIAPRLWDMLAARLEAPFTLVERIPDALPDYFCVEEDLVQHLFDIYQEQHFSVPTSSLANNVLLSVKPRVLILNLVLRLNHLCSDSRSSQTMEQLLAHDES